MKMKYQYKKVIKIITESKRQIDKNINQKKDNFEKELEKEVNKAEKEIIDLKKIPQVLSILLRRKFQLK